MYVHTFTINKIYYVRIVNKEKKNRSHMGSERATLSPSLRAHKMKNEIFIQPKQLIIK